VSHSLFPIIIFVIVLVTKVLSNASRASGGPTPRPRSPGPRGTEDEEERMRRFMEAVGLPPNSVPPPQVRPRPAVNPAPLLPVNPPPVHPLAGDIRRARPAIPPAPPVPSAPLPRPAYRHVSSIPQKAISLPQQPVAPIQAVAPIQPAEPVIAPLQASMSTAPLGTPSVQTEITTRALRTDAQGAPFLLGRLRTRSAIREAIILREVLGPPKAFEPENRGLFSGVS